MSEHALTVTFTRGVVREFRGLSALRHAIEYADERDLRVCTFSTPASILDDLRGPHPAPEPRMLRSVGRLDLLDEEG